jgi:hypothetical protein
VGHRHFGGLMKFDLAAMAARKRISRRPVIFRRILTTKAQADTLARIFRAMLEPWSRAADILGPLYQAELDRVLQHDSAEDLGSTTDAIAQAINRLILELTPDLRRWALRTEQWHRGKWVRAVLAGVEVDLDLIIGPNDMRETIDAWLVRNTSLVRDVNEQARGKIADAVLRGHQQRSPISEVMKEVRAATGFATKRARRVAADLTVKLASALDAERQRQAGMDVWKWNHSDKLHPRPEHVARDGKLYADEPEHRGKLGNGQEVLVPPPDRPGELPFCGCVRQAVLVFEGELL